MEYGEGGRENVDLLVKFFTLYFSPFASFELVVTGKDFCTALIMNVACV